MTNIPRLYRTIKHLTLKQIYFRLYYYIINRLLPVNFKKIAEGKTCTRAVPYEIKFRFIPASNSYKPPSSFSFLNISHDFKNNIDWNLSCYSKLWTYNLNYFDYLLQPGIKIEKGIDLVKKYIKDLPEVKDGLEPYPTSIRIINWVKFCLQNKINDELINKSIHGHTRFLSGRIEYHLLANHLLENAFALCFGGFYTGDKELFEKGRKLLSKELKEQILPDGAHFELSAMYHKIILEHLLDLIQITDVFPLHKNWGQSLKIFAGKMLGWIAAVSFYNSNIPLFNDAAFGIAPDTKSLLNYGENLGIKSRKLSLKESGYRKFTGQDWEIVVDVGNITPSYQPGHAHADTFSFELYYNGKPLIVDTGTSTYETCERRCLERATKSHNTVELFKTNSSEVWSSHRVGRRAQVCITEETSNIIVASHNGYKNKGAIHQRSLQFKSDLIVIKDYVIFKKREKNKFATAYFHFAPGFLPELKGSELYIYDDGIKIQFFGEIKSEIFKYNYAPQFNKLLQAFAVKVEFNEKLKTVINF